jgi:RNA polymerase sigma-70 factor, ECF subfamily
MELTIDESPEEAELARLAREARGGGVDAYDRLANRVRERVRRWAQRLTRDSDDAEDIAQDVLLKLRAGAAEFEGRSRFTTWLYRVTRNVAFDRKRTEERRSTLLAHVARPGDPSFSASDDESASDGIADDVEQRLASLLRQYYTVLPPRQRQIFELADLQGRSSVDIAGMLGIEPSTVRVTLLKARRTLRLKMLAAHPRLLEDYRS